MSYIGYYINLERSPDRRAAMEARFAALTPAVEYRRFPAVDGNRPGQVSRLSAGQAGCFTSHHRLLGMHLDGADHLHIVEDDIVMARRMPMFVEQIVASGLMDRFDILFTDCPIPPAAGFHRTSRERLQKMVVRDAAGLAETVEFDVIPYVATTGSYIVNRQSIRKIYDLLGEELTRGPNRAIDLYIRDLTARGQLRTACLFPFITGVYPGEFDSTIQPDAPKWRSHLAMDLLRYSYFVECDLPAALKMAETLPVNPAPDLHEQLTGRVIAFAQSNLFDSV